ncbi:hypothetical protein [Tahibacter soli]|uniref:Uncharacterized protein n=1 Tax=Tahibacter soli TaxID=2983605 RepID=A0A9X3YK26_9GAMM|nr:hypothetical protein [Tahibacter soli]MDC8012233.1 hypothetical protein [Tahibacter soli]
MSLDTLPMPPPFAPTSTTIAPGHAVAEYAAARRRVEQRVDLRVLIGRPLREPCVEIVRAGCGETLAQQRDRRFAAPLSEFDPPTVDPHIGAGMRIVEAGDEFGEHRREFGVVARRGGERPQLRLRCTTSTPR